MIYMILLIELLGNTYRRYKMSIQDDAFDIEEACKKKCPESAREFIEYTWTLEEELGETRRINERLRTCLDILGEQALRMTAKRRREIK